jgi:hypothetical protein
MSEIEIIIRINDNTLEVNDVRIGLSVNDNLSIESMDYILAETFKDLSNNLYKKISKRLEIKNNKVN